MIYIDLRRSTITGVKKYTQRLIEQGIYDRAIGGDWLEKNFDIPHDRVVCNDYDFKANAKLPLKSGDVLHCPFSQYPYGFRGNTVVTIHDLIPLTVKGNVSFIKKLIYYIKLRYIVKHTKHIIAISESTRKDIVRYLKADPDKITVVYNGVNLKISKLEPEEAEYIYDKFMLAKDRKMILMVGNRQNNKNMGRALRAYAGMRNRDKVMVVIVGRKIKEEDEVDKAINDCGIRDSVAELQDISDTDLNVLYNISNVFLFPSLYEGFGTPPLEAMSCGTPVICSNATSLPEVVGDAAYMVDPYDIEGMSEALDKVMFDEDLRTELIGKGYKRIDHFRWEDTAAKTLEILRRYVG